MADLFPPTREEMIACVEREIRMRRRVYPSWVAKGKQRAEVAEKEIATMEAVLATLRRLS